jgi:hypothetical protein
LDVSIAQAFGARAVPEDSGVLPASRNYVASLNITHVFVLVNSAVHCSSGGDLADVPVGDQKSAGVASQTGFQSLKSGFRASYFGTDDSTTTLLFPSPA